jgi:hypothetical protein
VPERQGGEVVQGVTLARLGPVDHAGDLLTVDEHVVEQDRRLASIIIAGMTTTPKEDLLRARS